MVCFADSSFFLCILDSKPPPFYFHFSIISNFQKNFKFLIYFILNSSEIKQKTMSDGPPNPSVSSTLTPSTSSSTTTKVALTHTSSVAQRAAKKHHRPFSKLCKPSTPDEEYVFFFVQVSILNISNISIFFFILFSEVLIMPLAVHPATQVTKAFFLRHISKTTTIPYFNPLMHPVFKSMFKKPMI